VPPPPHLSTNLQAIGADAAADWHASFRPLYHGRINDLAPPERLCGWGTDRSAMMPTFRTLSRPEDGSMTRLFAITPSWNVWTWAHSGEATTLEPIGYLPPVEYEGSTLWPRSAPEPERAAGTDGSNESFRHMGSRVCSSLAPFASAARPSRRGYFRDCYTLHGVDRPTQSARCCKRLLGLVRVRPTDLGNNRLKGPGLQVEDPHWEARCRSRRLRSWIKGSGLLRRPLQTAELLGALPLLWH
jgi:hypothetical protein